MHFEFIESIGDVDEKAWNALWPSNYPFTKHQFLLALERSQSTCTASGWTPKHMIARGETTLVFAMPLYLKHHSYGEYVFDWSWADAYARCGLEYYPKLLNAIPFTPASGPRFASTHQALKEKQLWQRVGDALKHECERVGASGFHSLFPDAHSQQPWKHNHFLQRHGCQFHWFNRDYQNFEEFISDFSSRKRKNIRKERQKCKDISIEFKIACDVSVDEWQAFYQLYHLTYLKRSGRPGYLHVDFFLQLAKTMPEQLILAQASIDKSLVAAAVYFRDDNCLYGRYWGSAKDVDGLHFETCYYRGIEYAIEHKLKHFDPGAQGEHKIQRGFQPIQTCSYHWIARPEFSDALAHFCSQEKYQNALYIDEARSYLPFKEGVQTVEDSVLMESSNWP